MHCAIIKAVTNGILVASSVGHSLSVKRYSDASLNLSLLETICVDKIDRLEFSPDGSASPRAIYTLSIVLIV
jgi:hypothetical protein